VNTKNILILTGSPRKNGNSHRMAEAFTLGALSKGHTVNTFSVADKTILGCTACDSCWQSGMPCIYRDDFDSLYPLLESADVLVYATPLYWFTFPAQLKAAIDKLYPYAGSRSPNPLKISESLLLVCGGDAEIRIFDGIIATYQEIASYMKWKDSGVLAVPAVHAIGDVNATEALDQAHQLGASL
jgi:multimeric flavodoxin WrbA